MLISLLALSLSTTALAQDFQELQPVRQPIGEDTPPILPPPAEELVGMAYDDFQRTYGGSSSWTYQMDYRLDPYAGPSIEAPFDAWVGQGAWRAHAMQWKDYVSSNGSTGPSVFGFDVTAVANSVASGAQYLPDMPVCQTTFGGTDDVRLNAAEADAAVFSVGDPAGTWMCEIESAPAVGMIFSALVMHYWGSPVYVPALHVYGPPYDGTVSHTAGLELIEFSHNLHQACGLSGTASAGTVLQGPFTCNSALVMQGTDATLWNHLYPVVPAGIYVQYEQHKALTPLELINAWQGAASFNGHMVFDPPAGASQDEAAGMIQLAVTLADQLMAVDSEGNLVMFRDLVAQETKAPLKTR